MYANQPLCQQIDEIYHQFFIFVCKPDSHTSLYETLAYLEQQGAIQTLSLSRWNGKHREIWHYRFVNQVPLRNGNDAMNVNWCELVISHEITGEILYRNAFITNHILTTDNVAIIVQAGRTRWKSKMKTTTP